LAQAIVERLVGVVGCRTLFATHYHELTALADSLPRVANLSVGSIEEGDRVVFTHAIQAGPAPRSYGLEVAKLSGLPTPVIERAKELLTTTAGDAVAVADAVAGAGPENNELPTEPARQLSLFGGAVSPKDRQHGAPRGSVGRPGQPVPAEQLLPQPQHKPALHPDRGLTALAAAVAALEPDGLSPRQAHQALYELKELLKARAGSSEPGPEPR
jgi:DNA mismatch repair protein MutS